MSKRRQFLHAFLYFPICKHISSSVAINEAHILKVEHLSFELSFKRKGKRGEKRNGYGNIEYSSIAVTPKEETVNTNPASALKTISKS